MNFSSQSTINWDVEIVDSIASDIVDSIASDTAANRDVPLQPLLAHVHSSDKMCLTLSICLNL